MSSIKQMNIDNVPRQKRLLTRTFFPKFHFQSTFIPSEEQKSLNPDRRYCI